MNNHNHSHSPKHDKQEKDLELKKEITQVILAAVFVIVIITAWVMTR